ncbi:MAG TPA: IPT/TIG domain-containing protein [Verrucomicrobiae bacterium]|nr:IPT/TIG domain-containing protein [Verrucomicrobiae bacterium]
MADTSPGEAHRRHIVYDAAHKYVFIANAAMNRLEVISAVDQSRVARISVSGATSADISADGTTLWAGSALNEIVAVDTSTLQIKTRYEQAGISPFPAAVFDRPIEVLSLATGQCFVRLRQSRSTEAPLALWDPVSNAMTDLTPTAGALFQNGLGPMARTGDHSAVIVAANDSSGNAAVFALNGVVSTGPRSLGSGDNASCKLAVWDASSPGQFKISPAKVAVQDIASTAGGRAFALQTAASIEIRDSGMYVTAVPTAAELNQIPGRVAVPGLAMHPTGALLYQPFLTGAAGGPNARGGVDISDACSGQLHMRIFLPQQLMTDVDALHGDFLAIDENGQRLFAITSLDGSPQNAALTVVQLASVPLALGSVSSPTISAAGGTTFTIRGSGFQAGIKVAIGGKPTMPTLVDMNTLTVVSPPVLTGPQQLTLTNVNGETVTVDAAVIAN